MLVSSVRVIVVPFPLHLIVMEKAQAIPRWRALVVRMLYVLGSGLTQLVKLHPNQRKMKCQSIAAQRADWTLEQQGCVHPLSHRRRGGNQYGRWETCQKCLARVSYQSTAATSKAKSKKKEMEVVQVTPALQQTLEAVQTQSLTKDPTQEIAAMVTSQIKDTFENSLNHMQGQMVQFGALLQQLSQGQALQWQALASLGIQQPSIPPVYPMDATDHEGWQSIK